MYWHLLSTDMWYTDIWLLTYDYWHMITDIWCTDIWCTDVLTYDVLTFTDIWYTDIYWHLLYWHLLTCDDVFQWGDDWGGDVAGHPARGDDQGQLRQRHRDGACRVGARGRGEVWGRVQARTRPWAGPGDLASCHRIQDGYRVQEGLSPWPCGAEEPGEWNNLVRRLLEWGGDNQWHQWPGGTGGGCQVWDDVWCLIVYPDLRVSCSSHCHCLNALCSSLPLAGHNEDLRDILAYTNCF